MHHLTGIELAGKLTRIRADIPITLVSGWIDELLEKQAEKNGIKNILMKPHTTEQLLQAIKDVTDGEKE